MAVKITAEITVKRSDLAAATVTTTDDYVAAGQVARYLADNLPTGLRHADVTVTVTPVKKDGTPKGDAETTTRSNTWA